MANESGSDELDREVDSSMRMFQRAQVGPTALIAPVRPARVLLVLDGSDQDDASVAAAAHLRQRFDVETLILDARDRSSQGEDGADVPTRDDDLAAARVAQVIGSRPLAPRPEEAYEAILAALGDHDVDLLIVPCPFGRDFQRVGTDSAGTVIDVLLSRCATPMLVIRREDQDLAAASGHVSVVVGAECDVEGRAASWAFGLIASGGTMTLNLVIEKEQFENIRSIVEALQPGAHLEAAEFSDALTKTHQGLHAAMAKTARESQLTYRLLPQAGEVAPPNPLHDDQQLLLVMPLEVDDRFGQGFVQDRIRRSPHPVLIVPGHVKQ